MPLERIRLFFTKFPLVSLFSAQRLLIRHLSTQYPFHQYNSPVIQSISLRFVDIRSIAFNQSAASMTLLKPRYSFSHFILVTMLEKY